MDAPLAYLRMESMWLIILDPGIRWDDKNKLIRAYLEKLPANG